MNETSILPFCANHQLKWNITNKDGEKEEKIKLLFTEDIQLNLGDAFKNCFPFNNENFEKLYNESLSYNIQEPCRNNYK